jgi:excisionase family DNA binding protein
MSSSNNCLFVPKFITTEEVAELTGLSIATIRRAIRDQKLKSHKFGRAVRISQPDLNEYLSSSRR